MISKFKFILLAMSLSILLTACYNVKRRSFRCSDGPRKRRPPHKGKVFSLQYCITTALAHSTDLELYMLQKNIKDVKVIAKTLDSLSGQAKHFYYINRNSNSSSYSVDNIISTKQLEKNINVLDFSMAYLNYFQKKDRSFTTMEEKQRIKQNLKFATTKIYFKIALAQSIIKNTEKTLLKCKKMEENLVRLSKSNKISPLRVLDERKRLIRFEKSLLLYRRKHKKACQELRIIMGLVKSKKVDNKCFEELKIAIIPNTDTLEKIALAERPEFSGLNIVINDIRKTIVYMIYNIKLGLPYRISHAFYFLQWKEIGISSAYVALRLPQELEKYRKMASKKEKNAARKLTLAIGITAQVRMAHASFLQTKDRYKLDDKTYWVYKNHLDMIIKKSVTDKTISKMELERLERETLEYFTKRLASMCDYYTAYYRLLNVTGMNSFEQPELKTVLNEISEAKNTAELLSKATIKRYLKINNELKYNKSLNKIEITKYNKNRVRLDRISPTKK